jgi:hypothetical protein
LKKVVIDVTGLGAGVYDRLQEQGGFSPDLGDAAALTFAIDFNAVVDESEERYRPYRGSQSWMGI